VKPTETSELKEGIEMARTTISSAPETTEAPHGIGASMPTPDRFFDAIWAYQRTAAIKAAIDLDVFTTIAAGAHTAGDIARRTIASERGARILCD
jgi:hypothetical protein